VAIKSVLREKLRLRGIDTPELGTKEGDAAKAFVQSCFLKDSSKTLPRPLGDQLGAGAKGVSLKEASQIILRSSRSDKYDRYLADIFIPSPTPGVGEVFLNNLLLEKGHAVRWEE
jgi:endonuclease YncB( thermonuclease family)